MSTQTVYLSHQKKKIVALLSYDDAKNDPSALQAMEDETASFKRFDSAKKYHPTWSLLTRTLSPLAGLSQKR
jgi:hypothetical protein